MSTSHPDSGILDRDHLLEQCGGNTDLCQRLLTRYAQVGYEDGATMSAAVATQDAEKLRFTAHRVKGTAATVCANASSELARQIEARSCDGEWEILADLVEQFQKVHVELQAALRAELAKSIG